MNQENWIRRQSDAMHIRNAYIFNFSKILGFLNTSNKKSQFIFLVFSLTFNSLASSDGLCCLWEIIYHIIACWWLIFEQWASALQSGYCCKPELPTLFTIWLLLHHAPFLISNCFVQAFIEACTNIWIHQYHYSSEWRTRLESDNTWDFVA